MRAPAEWTIAQVATLLNRTPEQVRTMIDRGELKAETVGAELRIPTHSVRRAVRALQCAKR